MEDKHLVESVLHGDTKSFGIIIRNTERLVLQIVFKMILHEEDRKDLVQDIYLKVFKKLGSFKFQSKLSTWIAQISYNTCLDYLRRRNVAVDSSVSHPHYDDEERRTGFMDQNKESLADYAVEQKEMSNTVRKCMEQLSPIYRTLITLFHQEEMSYDEIRKITNLPEGTIKSYLFRGRKELKEMILKQHKREDIC